jgi:hypothetical protein
MSPASSAPPVAALGLAHHGDARALYAFSFSSGSTTNASFMRSPPDLQRVVALDEPLHPMAAARFARAPRRHRCRSG